MHRAPEPLTELGTMIEWNQVLGILVAGNQIYKGFWEIQTSCKDSKLGTTTEWNWFKETDTSEFKETQYVLMFFPQILP